ncbi:MAG TPA: hypothetical protein HA364_04640 [Thermoplasmata archaeon]|nr:hypothetical protein [Thermoplasmata archaeon]
MLKFPCLLTSPKKRRMMAVVAVIAVAVVVSWTVFYYVIRSAGTGPLVWPELGLTMHDSAGLTITVTDVTHDVDWSSAVVMLEDLDGGVLWDWRPTQDGLTDPEGDVITLLLTSSNSLGNMTVYCTVTDISGNGCINIGDYIALMPIGGELDAESTYEVRFIYAPMDELMGSLKFQPGEGELEPSSLSLPLAAIASAASVVSVIVLVAYLRRKEGTGSH